MRKSELFARILTAVAEETELSCYRKAVEKLCDRNRKHLVRLFFAEKLEQKPPGVRGGNLMPPNKEVQRPMKNAGHLIPTYRRFQKTSGKCSSRLI